MREWIKVWCRGSRACSDWHESCSVVVSWQSFCDDPALFASEIGSALKEKEFGHKLSRYAVDSA